MIGYLYEGLGNTFIITSNVEENKLSKIAFINCKANDVDGLINYNSQNNKMSIYNQDGSKALMCGNGISGLSYHLFKTNHQNKLIINTDVGIKEITLTSSSPFKCKVSLGRARIIKELSTLKAIRIENQEFPIQPIFLSTFHIVIMVDDINSNIIDKYAKKIYEYDLFKQKCNITFCQLVSYHTIKTKTYERGVGFTKSCGSGAASAAYICYLLYNLSSSITVIQEKGELSITIDHDVYLEGSANYIKEVSINE